MSQLTIIGMGSRLCGDDAIGVHVLDELRDWDEPRLELVEGGLDALGMLDLLHQRENVLIIDATRMGSEPGSVKAFSKQEVSLVVSEDHLSLHGIGLTEALQLGESLGLLPQNLNFIGIQPLSVNVGSELSTPVQSAIEPVLQLVRETLNSSIKETEAYRGTGGTAIA